MRATTLVTDGKPWPVPDSWEWVSIGEVTNVAIGGTPPRARSDYYGGNIPWVKPGELRDQIICGSKERITKAGLIASKSRLFPKRTVLMARAGSTAGRLGILARRAATSDGVLGIRPSKHLLPEYLFYFLEVKRPSFVDSGKATTAFIHLSTIRRTLIPLAPLKEQRRIAKEIESRVARLQADTAEMERLRVRLNGLGARILADVQKSWRSSDNSARAVADQRPAAEELLMRFLIERRPKRQEKANSAVGNSASTSASAHSGRTSTSLPSIPKSWIWTTADQLCADIHPGPELRLSNQPTGCPLVGAKNVQDDFVDLKAAIYISEEDFERCPQRCKPRKNDLLIVGRGVGVGRAAVVTVDERFLIGKDVLLVRPLVESRFLLNWVQSPFGQDWIRAAAGYGFWAHLTVADFKRMPVPLPPLDEQRRVVEDLNDRLRPIHNLDSLVRSLLKRGEALRRNTLKAAFEGTLPQIRKFDSTQ